MSSDNHDDSEGLFGTIKVGFGAGLVAGCALFSSFLSIFCEKISPSIH